MPRSSRRRFLKHSLALAVTLPFVSSGLARAFSQVPSLPAVNFDWVARRADGSVTVAPLPYGSAESFPEGAVMYGSMTHDKAGRFYVVGSMHYKPVVLQVTP